MKTPVEFLVQEINKLTGLTISMDEPCILQAKEMEKEQRIKDIDFGHGNPSWVDINYEAYFELSE